MKISPLIALSLTLGSLSLMASEVELKATKLSLFKAGYGYVSLEGTLPDATDVELKSLPIPVHGSFWVEAEQGVEIDRVVSSMKKYKKNLHISEANLLISNPGKKVTLRFSSTGADDVRSITGSVVAPPKVTKLEKKHTVSVNELTESDSPDHQNIILFQTEQGLISINVHNIEEINFHEPITFPTEIVESPIVTLELEKASAGKKIYTNCLSEELSWIPSYRLELRKDGTATLDAKAAIINNTIDLENVSLELVSGAPSQLDTSQIDPMALITEDVLQQAFGKQILVTENRIYSKPFNRQYVNTNYSNNYIASNGHFEDDFEDESSDDADATPAQGTDTGELFFYPVEGFSMKAGDVITQPLYSTTLAYKKIYTWKLNDPTEFEVELAKNTPENLWSCIRFTNPLDMPLTSAPIEIIEEGRFAGMNKMEYTQSQSDCTIQLSRALSIEVKKEAAIIDSKRISMGFKSGSRNESTSDVTLTMQNNMDEAIEMEVSQSVVGDIISSSDGAKIQSRANPYASYNKLQHTIRWNITIPAKSKKELKFQYKFID